MFGLLQFLSAVALVGAVPMLAAEQKCTTVVKRPAWHEMKDEDKKSYLAADKCIMTSPAKLGKFPGAKTRWDELAGLHQVHALTIHSTGNFLPYHRYFLKVHEALLNECGYKGPLPWWDETLDAGKFTTAKILDPVVGFGGSGRGARACVPDGPFANVTVMIGPGFKSQPRCINRRVSNPMSQYSSKTVVDAALEATDYVSAYKAISAGPHTMGHGALMMMDGDSITSSGDPLFLLHHGFIDKLWWDWQQADPKRLTEIAGPNAQDPKIGFDEFPGDMEQEAVSFGWGHPGPDILAITPDPQAGDRGSTITLNHVLSSLGLIPNATVKDVMDTKGGYFCYEY